ncbi:hypothetical protein MUO69_04770 [Candidatus Bathyarchaeota archaeon]|jgi:hypothetical protein|nr:hypothetical protein [Candidatus Bathyarchaeota archaeon]
MSGGYEGDIETREIVKEVMNNYGVDEETAVRIMADRNVFALKKFEKWRENYLKLRRSD